MNVKTRPQTLVSSRSHPRRFTSSLIAILSVMVVTVLSAGCGVSSNDVAQAAPREHAAHTHAERDPDRLWCNEHGVYEDECTICDPELAAAAEERDPNRLWCNEHGVYEDECTICHPEMALESSKTTTGTGTTTTPEVRRCFGARSTTWRRASAACVIQNWLQTSNPAKG